MVGRIVVAFCSTLITLALCQAEQDGLNVSYDLYSLSAIDIKGNEVDFEKYRGKIVLVVNVASHCGFTHAHYRHMVKLQRIFGPSGLFHILAFPCNQFGNQEPGTNEDIEKFARENYDINFELFSKVNVIGPDAHVAWKFITENAEREPNWNFWKFLVNAEGQVLRWWSHEADVEDVTPHVQKQLIALRARRERLPLKAPEQHRSMTYTVPISGSNRARGHDDL